MKAYSFKGLESKTIKVGSMEAQVGRHDAAVDFESLHINLLWGREKISNRMNGMDIFKP